MMLPEDIMRLTDLMAAATGRSPHSIGSYAAGHGDFYGRLRAGRDLHTRKAARVVQWLSDHWPADLTWPADLPRPAPARAGAALPEDTRKTGARKTGARKKGARKTVPEAG